MNTAFLLAGGLGLFLYGAEEMSRSIKKIAGAKLKGLLRRLATNRIAGVFTGAIATAIFQTSTVTTVMVVSFVNAGLMALPQAIAIILGAHIGTTITAQLIAFRIESVALPIIAVGALIYFFSRRETLRSTGKILFGFGIIFLGLILMTQAFEPLQDNATFNQLLDTLGQTPVLGFLAGMLITSVVQSSTVTTGITIALALSNVITLPEAMPLILGENIGTTITANILAMKGSRTAKQAARAHFLTNAIGAVIALLLLKPFMSLVLALSPADTARQIANTHTLFNILNTILFLPLIPAVAWMSDKLIFGSRKDQEELYYLDETTLREDVGSSIDQARQGLHEMLGLARERLKILQDGIKHSAEREVSQFHELGEKILRFQSRITEFLEKIGARDPNKQQSVNLSAFVRILHEIERIYDYEEKMRDVLRRMESEGREFHAVESKELRNYCDNVIDLMRMTHIFLHTDVRKKQALQIIGTYETLYKRKDDLRAGNRKRFQTRKTQVSTANYFDDIVTSHEEIAKKCRNIATALIK